MSAPVREERTADRFGFNLPIVKCRIADRDASAFARSIRQTCPMWFGYFLIAAVTINWLLEKT